LSCRWGIYKESARPFSRFGKKKDAGGNQEGAGQTKQSRELIAASWAKKLQGRWCVPGRKGRRGQQQAQRKAET